MSKTPIMILQELGVKEGFLPKYNSIYSQSGVNVNVFTFEVRYKEFLARGQALNKKEAKQKAAQNMLMILDESTKIKPQIKPYIKPPTRPLLPFRHINTDTSKVTPLNPILQNPTVANEDLNNYIGSLQEYCVENRLMQPMYEVSHITGLAHQKNFTMSCKIGAMSEEGVGTTKKQAKQQVAKKMLLRLQSSTALIIPTNQSEASTNDSSAKYDNESTEADTYDVKYNESTEKDIYEELGLRLVNLNVVNTIPQKDIETKYFQLSSKNCSPAVLPKEDINFQNYHLFFKRYIYDNICDGKEEEVTVIYNNINKFKSNLSDIEKLKTDTDKIIFLEQQILRYIKENLKLNVEKKTISCKNPLLKMVAFKISTPLPIIQFGANSNIIVAGAIALRNILDTVMIYLK